MIYENKVPSRPNVRNQKKARENISKQLTLGSRRECLSINTMKNTPKKKVLLDHIKSKTYI